MDRIVVGSSFTDQYNFVGEAAHLSLYKLQRYKKNRSNNSISKYHYFITTLLTVSLISRVKVGDMDPSIIH